MNEATQRVDVRTRPYREDDEAGVLEVLSVALGAGPAGPRTSELFRWKHLDNPFGRSYLLVAEADQRIVGLRALMRWSFRSGDRTVRAVRAVDTATHPSLQGRGIFSRLTLEAIDGIREDTDLVFNTPNEKSLPGYLKMGWRVVGTVRISVRVRKPSRFLGGFRDLQERSAAGSPGPSIAAETALEALSDPGVGALLDEVAHRSDHRLITPRDVRYLRWRYGLAPLLDYRAIREHRSGALRGLAVFRVRLRGRLWESTIAELIVRPGDVWTALRLLRRVVAAAPVDHLTCRFPGRTPAARAALGTGFLPSPGGMTFVVNELHHGRVRPNPSDIRSWALTLGDLEVF